jgi:hypothetical protein
MLPGAWRSLTTQPAGGFMYREIATASALLAILMTPVATRAQADTGEPPAVTFSGSGMWLAPDAALVFTLSRPLRPDEGTIAVLVADVDVTAMLSISGERASYRPRAVPLPTGQSETVVFIVTPAGTWQELARAPLRVLAPGGFERADLVPRLAVNNAGQVAEGHAQGAATPDRTEFQDFTMNLGVQTMLARGVVEVRTQSNMIGASRREEALRFSALQEEAPRFDLADYLVSVEAGALAARVGHVSFGSHRHLLSGHAGRGAAASVRAGSFGRLEFAGLSSAPVVGWSHLLGMDRSNHRVLGSTLGLELLPARPGMLQLEFSAVHGTSQPLGGFSQGFVGDVERSRGGAARLAAALPSQRARVDAGYARTRFDNPVDPALSQGQDLVPVEATTRAAHYVDVSVDALRRRMLAGVPLSVALSVRHEKVEPLYRAVALAGARADILQNTYDVTAAVGPLGLRLSHARGRDNLDDVAAVLTSRTVTSSATLDLPLVSLFGSAAPSWLPALTAGLMRMHQFGDGIPEGFAETHVPDQVTTSGAVGAQSGGSRWRFGVRHERSLQDNRQATREQADFASHATAVTVGLVPSSRVDISLDLSREHADARERDEKAGASRAAGLASWRPFGGTTVIAGYGVTRRSDEPRTATQYASDARVELSQRINLFGTRSGRTPAQLFVRYSRFGAVLEPSNGERTSSFNWTIATGATISLF